jgi:hypothetical protein
MINSRGFGRNRLWPNQVTIPNLLGETEEHYESIAGVSAAV